LLILGYFTAIQQYKWRETRVWYWAWHSHQYETWVDGSNHVSSIKDWRICKLLLWVCVMLHFIIHRVFLYMLCHLVWFQTSSCLFKGNLIWCLLNLCLKQDQMILWNQFFKIKGIEIYTFGSYHCTFFPPLEQVCCYRSADKSLVRPGRKQATFPAFYGTWGFITTFTRVHHLSVP